MISAPSPWPENKLTAECFTILCVGRQSGYAESQRLFYSEEMFQVTELSSTAPLNFYYQWIVPLQT